MVGRQSEALGAPQPVQAGGERRAEGLGRPRKHECMQSQGTGAKENGVCRICPA
jgi:hypothetical protein